jgi:hypothetical protein
MNKDLDADLQTVNETSLEENPMKAKEGVNDLISFRSSKMAFNETSKINLQSSGNQRDNFSSEKSSGQSKYQSKFRDAKIVTSGEMLII